MAESQHVDATSDRASTRVSSGWLRSRAESAQGHLRSVPSALLGPAARVLVSHPFDHSTPSGKPAQLTAVKSTRQTKPRNDPVQPPLMNDVPSNRPSR